MKKVDKKRRFWNLVSSCMMLLLVLASGYLLYQVWKLNMLPAGYLLALTGGLVVVNGLICLLLTGGKRGKWQKRPEIRNKIIGCVISGVFVLGCFVAGGVVARVQGTIHAITAPEKVNVILEVYVRQEDEAQHLQDAAEYAFAIAADMPEEDVEKILDELETILGTSVKTVAYPGSGAALEALLNGEVGGAILDTTYLAVLEDVEGYGDILDRLRVLHELIIEKEVLPQTQPPKGTDSAEETVSKKPADVLSAPFLVYISGNDARRQELIDGGSDVNILFLVNPQSHQILMINTPRDYYVINHASGNGSRDKLSHCGLKGINNCILALSELYDQEIDYYARINFSGFRTLVDAIGGVTVYSDVAFKAGEYYIQQGENHLNGAQALRFARERKNLPGGDNDRGKNQMKLISAMIRQLSVGNLISNYTEILKSLEGMFSTNFPAEDIGRLVQLQLKEMPDWEILTFAVTGDNGTDLCWHTGYYAYVMYPHAHMVEHASELMERFLNGEVLTEADLVPVK